MLSVPCVQLVEAGSLNERPATRFERLFRRMTQFEAQYVQGEAAFEQTRFRAALPAGELPAPPIDGAYLDRINRVFLDSLPARGAGGARGASSRTVAADSPASGR
jgi:hypothetical protein